MRYRDKVKELKPGITDEELNRGAFCPKAFGMIDDCVYGGGDCKKCWDKELIESNSVNHPPHYTDGKIEVIDYIEDKKLGFCLGNAVKYISRAGKKDPSKEIEDLEKAKWYIDRRIMGLEAENEQSKTG